MASQNNDVESWRLGPFTVPRLFTGLWQLSSPAWGTASRSRMLKHFEKHVKEGFTAFDMADHYGDAEFLFGRFRSAYQGPERIVGATKYCVFDCSVPITEELVRDAVTQRLNNMKSATVDLLQFHWQDYTNREYIQVARLLAADQRVTVLGLCNFDTKRMLEIIEAGVPIATNQVQFSLIDSRPRYAMANVCLKYNIKLTTYGTLCGGFLAEKWLGEQEPDPFGDNMTPSLRKYLEMINTRGNWCLFQDLLKTLKQIGDKHHLTISAVATLIVGTRMGVSEHTAENKKVYGWRLDEEDQQMIEDILRLSARDGMFRDMGDCGGEYGERG
ncbi:hypothetical protein KEM56_001090 [Ascosphaera pollenicola]|nr:hypothetical protein KEM56_001090 [Ascosphaera pollenicola]